MHCTIQDEVPPDQNDDAQFKESGADEGVRERRVELVGRMRAQSQYLGNVVAGKLVSDDQKGPRPVNLV